MHTRHPHSSRHNFSLTIINFSLFLSLLLSSCGTADGGSCHTLLIGSYCYPGDSALRVYSFNEADTSAELLYALPVDNASYFTQSPDLTVYAVTERGDSDSFISALRSDPSSDTLRVIGRSQTGSAGSCYVAVSPDGRFAVTANYSGGSISVFPLDSCGLPGTPQLIRFEGHGPIKGRQDTSHPHCITFTPDGRLMLVDDLGTDCIHTFPLPGGADSIAPAIPADDIILPPASGPRHLVFNRRGDTAYLINEISDSVTVLRYDGRSLTPVQHIAADTASAHGAGDIALSHDGRRLYASLRLRHEGIATFDVDTVTGLLTHKAHTPAVGHPRQFTLSPDGSLLLVACRDANAVLIFTLDPHTGIPTPTGRPIPVPSPVCTKFIR